MGSRGNVHFKLNYGVVLGERDCGTHTKQKGLNFDLSVNKPNCDCDFDYLFTFVLAETAIIQKAMSACPRGVYTAPCNVNSQDNIVAYLSPYIWPIYLVIFLCIFALLQLNCSSLLYTIFFIFQYHTFEGIYSTDMGYMV